VASMELGRSRGMTFLRASLRRLWAPGGVDSVACCGTTADVGL
jgi:hypothetical protein